MSWLVNKMFNYLMYYMQKHWHFCWKNISSHILAQADNALSNLAQAAAVYGE